MNGHRVARVAAGIESVYAREPAEGRRDVGDGEPNG
jgi:hypothetical protein